MAKSNLTVQLEADVIRRAKILAARRGTSVSSLVAQQLDALVARDERYEAASQRALELLGAAIEQGGRTWTRDGVYAERLDRYGE